MNRDHVYAEYRPGCKPILVDYGEATHGFISFANGSRITVDDLIDLRNRVFIVIPHEGPDTHLKTEFLFLSDEWRTLSRRKRQLLGMGLAFLVNTDRVPLECLNPHKSGARIYCIQQ